MLQTEWAMTDVTDGMFQKEVLNQTKKKINKQTGRNISTDVLIKFNRDEDGQDHLMQI